MERHGATFAAVGRLPGNADHACVGFVRDGAGYALGFIGADEMVRVARPAQERDLVAAVIAWFEGSLADPPQDLEATQEDLASVVRSLAAGLGGTPQRALLVEACDAMDDGLAEDVVVRRLATAAEAMRRETDEQIDWVDLLVERYRVLRGA